MKAKAKFILVCILSFLIKSPVNAGCVNGVCQPSSKRLNKFDKIDESVPNVRDTVYYENGYRIEIASCSISKYTKRVMINDNIYFLSYNYLSNEWISSLLFFSDPSIYEVIKFGFPEGYSAEVYINKLPSIDHKVDFYHYTIYDYESSGKSLKWLTILPDSLKPDLLTEHIELGDSIFDLNILGWSHDTVKIVCVQNGKQPKNLKPYCKEVRPWKNWYIEFSYYYTNSWGARDVRTFDSCKITKDEVIFYGEHFFIRKNEKFKIRVKKGQALMSFTDSVIYVGQLQKSMDFIRLDDKGKTLTNQPAVSIYKYTLKPRRKIDWERLKDSGISVEYIDKNFMSRF
ncbi:MAG: hypothetical protein HYZ42_10710 [Bacteroidetes bacterium]|nr:hypothetical protein [Bacteroidota bacterium]